MNLKKLMSSPTLYWSVLSIGHITVLIFLLQKFGLNTSNEGAKYLTLAEDICNGHFTAHTQYQTFYTAYIFYLAIYKLFNLPVMLIFAGNYVLSLFAYRKFHQLLKSLFDQRLAKIWLLLIALSPLIQYWQLNLFSETFFIAISLLFIYSCLYPNLKYRLIKAGPLGLIAIFSRPTGILTVICLLLYTLYKYGFMSRKRGVILGIILLTSLFSFVFFVFKLPYHDFARYISNGSIYYGFPSWDYPELPPGDYTLFNCYEFLYQTQGSKTILFLFIKKIDSFFVLSRPYYSNFHNLINQCHYIFYLLSAIGLVLYYNKQGNLSLLKILGVIILLNCLTVGLLFNEWSERFTLQVFPYILVLSAFAISFVYSSFFRSK